jgi:hypothetical protein
MAVAATALGVFNRVQINQLKQELFKVKENVGRLFEVVQDFSSNFAALETGFNEISTTLLYQVMFNPTLFDSRLSHLENQLRGHLQRVTHAIQAAMHQRFAIDYLNPAEMVHLFEQLAGWAEEARCDLLVQYHLDLFQVKTSLLFNGQDGHILIHVPMAPKGTLLRLFRLHPFPLPMFDTHHLMINAEAISSSEVRYNVQLSLTDLLSCHWMNQVFMCDSFGVMSKWFNDTCLGALYMQRFKLVRGLCKFRVVPLKEQVYQVRKGQYLVYSPEASTAAMRCRNGSHWEIHLQKGTQQIKIPAGCQGFFLDHLATSDYFVRLASEVLHFGWDWDPLTLLLAGDIADIGRMLRNLSDMHLQHPDLLELQIHHSTEQYLIGHRKAGSWVAGAHQQCELLLRFIRHRDGSYHHPDHHWDKLFELPPRGNCPAVVGTHCRPCSRTSGAKSRRPQPQYTFRFFISGPSRACPDVSAEAPAKTERLLWTGQL